MYYVRYINDSRVIYIVGIMYTFNIITFVTPLCTFIHNIHFIGTTFFDKHFLRPNPSSNSVDVPLPVDQVTAEASSIQNNRLLQIQHRYNKFDAAILYTYISSNYCQFRRINYNMDNNNSCNRF